mgnify:CR=1 FL=1
MTIMHTPVLESMHAFVLSSVRKPYIIIDYCVVTRRKKRDERKELNDNKEDYITRFFCKMSCHFLYNLFT